MPGLDPGIHSGTVTEWIAGSSPAMTAVEMQWLPGYCGWSLSIGAADFANRTRFTNSLR
jgi:hypothetical protein